jgi:hypothetical protein
MPVDASRPTFSAHLVFGLVIIVVGVLFTLDNLNVVDGGEYLYQYWPVALIAIGAAKMIESGMRGGSLVGGGLLTAAGTWLLLDHLDVIEAGVLDFWPIILVVVGCVIVWQGLQGVRIGRRTGRDGGPGAADHESVVSAVAVLSGVSRGSNSPRFRGGELMAFMGGCEIDLRQAAIDGEAVIDVFAMWGGIDIRVPENWRVIGHVTPLLGGFDDTTRPPKEATTQTLVVRGVVIMGGIEIKN